VQEEVLDLISGLCQLVLTLRCPFDTGLRLTQGAPSGTQAVVFPYTHAEYLTMSALCYMMYVLFHI
jgi:hypothetical protein